MIMDFLCHHFLKVSYPHIIMKNICFASLSPSYQYMIKDKEENNFSLQKQIVPFGQ